MTHSFFASIRRSFRIMSPITANDPSRTTAPAVHGELCYVPSVGIGDSAMKRREFIGLIGGAAVLPLAARAQLQARKFYRIGVLSPERLPPELLESFYQGLRELGYVEGQNIAFEIRNAEGDGQRLAAFASELVGLKVDAILAVNTPAAQAAKKATAIIPIVISRLADPVKTGLVPNLFRPGGNITGVSIMSDELSAKRIGLLKEALPNVSRVAA